MSSVTSTTAPAHTAPDIPPAQAPAPSAEPPADGPAAAVWAALTASPGATAAAIADVAGISRAAAGRELGALRADGRAVKTPGVPDGRRGTPAATWAPAGPGDAAVHAASGLGEETDDVARLEKSQGDAAPPAGPGIGEAAADAPDPGAAEPGAAGDGELAPQGAVSNAGTETREAATPEAASANPGDAAAPATPGDATAGGPARGASTDGEAPARAADPGVPGRAAPAAGDIADDAAGPPADHAAGALRDLSEAAARALTAVVGGEPTAALAEVAAIRAAAAESARLVRAAAAGRASPATRPGGLRDLVDAHLHAHPGTDFTAGQIGKVLDRSAGAIANALDRLTTMKRAELTCESPRRYQAAPASPAPAAR